MCGIAGIINLSGSQVEGLRGRLDLMGRLLAHRGPDGAGAWEHASHRTGLTHRRLAIIAPDSGKQPMSDPGGNWITFNGEIYNYRELRRELGEADFRTKSDTEVILHAYRKWGEDCVHHLRGMFAFALWDEERGRLFCARDRFGIKPFYYSVVGDTLYFASEAKAILPFLPGIETDFDGLKDYLCFQFCLAGKTLFKGIGELQPGHVLTTGPGGVTTRKYWEVFYNLDFHHTQRHFEERLTELLKDSVSSHLVSDVPVGAYVSGGLDSSAIVSLATDGLSDVMGFTGKFQAHGQDFDESRYARLLAEDKGFTLHEADITAADFIEHVNDVIYHLDQPVAGPGSFSQYMVSRLAAKHRKVLLGGQGGDEIFGGYTRYLIAYFEQCIKAAIDGTMHDGNFVVTYESIIPNLETLKNYKPLLQQFWSEGLFEDMERRYFRLVNRSGDLREEIDWNLLSGYSPYETFLSIFNGANVGKESYFDRMTHFDFKTLLPALLHVEDRVSMAHGVESRVPLLDHPLVELAATIPADIKFKNGDMKHIFKKVTQPLLPQAITGRKDKMGFPTPFTTWIKGEAAGFCQDLLAAPAARHRGFVDNRLVLDNLRKEKHFGRKAWGFISLELWHQTFHDKQAEYLRMAREATDGAFSTPHTAT